MKCISFHLTFEYETINRNNDKRRVKSDLHPEKTKMFLKFFYMQSPKRNHFRIIRIDYISKCDSFLHDVTVVKIVRCRLNKTASKRLKEKGQKGQTSFRGIEFSGFFFTKSHRAEVL